MKLAWMTDIHLNFLNNDKREVFYEEVKKSNCDANLITGDIAEAPSIIELLREMANYLQQPIYFVLGNHDYYRGSVQDVRKTLTQTTNTDKYLFWLPASELQILNSNTILLGQDGWADGRLGDYQNSPISLTDSVLIADLLLGQIMGPPHLLRKMQELADADAKELHNDLLQAIKLSPQKIIVLTHVPPFKEACLHLGRFSDDNWLPYFSSKVMGDTLFKIANENPKIDFLVLSGHTHCEAFFQPLDNLIVKIGKAEYRYPKIQEVLVL